MRLGRVVKLHLEEIAHNRVESRGLIPLHPMGTLIENVELGIGNQLEQWKRPHHCSPTIIVPPKDQGLRLQGT